MINKIQGIDIQELSGATAQICDEKGLGKEKVLTIIEEALAAAYKKDYGKKGQIIKAKFNPKEQTVSFFQIKEVVDKKTRLPETENYKVEDKSPQTEIADEREKTEEDKEEKIPYFKKEKDIYLKDAKKIKKDVEVGDQITIKLKTETQFGRVAAQSAKQVIIQKLREAEKEILYEEFKNKEGKVITATVQHIEGRNVHLDLGKMTGVLLPTEQVPTENYRAGQKIKVYVEKVEKGIRDTAMILSRSNPNLVSQLFNLEVPEIFTGTVVIKSIAREAGSRSKIAVKSLEEGVDPIGSCVGQKGIRVQAVIDELGGEKIDIIEYNKNVKTFIIHSLSPAKIKYVDLVDKKEKKAIVYVDSDQLSLAIGRKGQNVRLAAKLTGWKIDIADQEEKEEEQEIEPKEEGKAKDSDKKKNKTEQIEKKKKKSVKNKKRVISKTEKERTTTRQKKKLAKTKNKEKVKKESKQEKIESSQEEKKVSKNNKSADKSGKEIKSKIEQKS